VKPGRTSRHHLHLHRLHPRRKGRKFLHGAGLSGTLGALVVSRSSPPAL
jgi:hypothetical protein